VARYRARRPVDLGAAGNRRLISMAIGVMSAPIRGGACFMARCDAEKLRDVFHIWRRRHGLPRRHGPGVWLAAIGLHVCKPKKIADVLDFVAPLPASGFSSAGSATSSTANCGAGPRTCRGESGVPDAQGGVISRTHRSSMRRRSQGSRVASNSLWFHKQPAARGCTTGRF